MGRLLCRVGLHRWHDDIDHDDGARIIVCNRCGTMQAKPFQIMARIGWVGHQNS
jgi:hypothetical protein